MFPENVPNHFTAFWLRHVLRSLSHFGAQARMMNIPAIAGQLDLCADDTSYANYSNWVCVLYLSYALDIMNILMR